MKKQKFTFTIMAMLFFASLSLNAQYYDQDFSAAFEPNDTYGTAVQIRPNSMLHGTISTSNDVDYYKIFISGDYPNPILYLTLISTQNLDLYLYDPNGSLIASSAGAYNSTELIKTHLNQTYVYYTIKVVGASSPYNYSLSNALYYNNPCSADEPNNSFSEAKAFPLFSSAKAGCISSSSDVDYHAVYADKPCMIKFLLTTSGRDCDLIIYNQSGTILRMGTSEGDESTYINVTSIGYYYVKVYGRNGAYGEAPYTLHVHRSYQCSYTNERNDYMADARGFVYTNYIFSGIESTTDIDWYKVTISGPSTINATLSNLVLDYDLGLYNSSGNYLAGSALGGTQNENIRYTTSQAGTYYLKVYGWDGAYDPNCYRVGASIGSARTGEEGIAIEEVDAPFNEASVEVFPNPIQMNGDLNVKIKSAEDGKFTTRIIGMDGAVVSEQEIIFQSGRSSINISGIKPGVYMLDLGEAGKQKLVIK